jgi:penicillin-binding protein 1A
MIELAQDRDGKVIYRADPRHCPTCNRPYSGDDGPRVPAPGEQVLDSITAYQVTSMLEGVVQRGTAAQARSLNRTLAGKTGTTNDYRSAWFVGYSPSMVVGVFVGFDDNRSLGSGETGAVDSVPVFIDFMGAAMKGKPDEDFRKPRDAKWINVHGITEAFRPGTEGRSSGNGGGGGKGGGDNPVGPQPYTSVWKNGEVTGANNAGTAVKPPSAPPPPKPAKKKDPDDLKGLY